MKRLLSLVVPFAAGVALAAPPPGHPTPGQAMDLLMPDKLPSAAELPNQGTVISSMDANDYSYIEVERGGSVVWIAAPKMVIRPGSIVRYENGSVMTNFYSKLLKRTFPSVMFVGSVLVTVP